MTGVKQYLLVKVFIIFLFLSISACDRQAAEKPSDAGAITLQVWAHAGQETERRVLQAQVVRYNYQSPNTKIELTFFPGWKPGAR